MVYVVGILGFLGGFALGLMILARLLKDRPAEELIHNNRLKWTYGLLNWVVAAIGSYSAVTLYNVYFG